MPFTLLLEYLTGGYSQPLGCFGLNISPFVSFFLLLGFCFVLFPLMRWLALALEVLPPRFLGHFQDSKDMCMSVFFLALGLYIAVF